ncbi:unnamed protein product [Amaranthus hypochondriacus]
MKSYILTATLPPANPLSLPQNFGVSNKFQYFSSFSASPALTTHLKLETHENIPDFHPKRIFILGMGYVGQYVAQQFNNQGWDVAGTCTSIIKKKVLEQKGFDVHIFDALKPEWNILDKLRCCTHLLVSIPPIEGIGDPILQHEKAFKARLVDGDLKWLCYLSTTSIYGDARGAWVDENYIPNPSSQLAKMRLKSEEGWLKLGEDLGISAYVFRLGGIYGPGRSAIDTILKEEISERQKKRATRKFTSRIHVADICQALRACISNQVQRKVYNIVDDDPASRAEVFAFAQQLIERRWPGLIDLTDYSIDTEISCGGEKRVSNALIKKELGLQFIFPSYRSGLQSIIDSMEDPMKYNGCNNNC